MMFMILSLLCIGAVSALPNYEERVVGGSDAAVGEYPYVVSLRRDGSHSCGGSILNERYILTAAHCVAGSENRPEVFSISYGSVDLYNKENIRNIIKVTRHKNYLPGFGFRNDVAVLELDEDITFGDNAQPTQLAEPTDNPGDNAAAILVGWGLNSTGGYIKDHLQKVDIILFTDAICKSTESQYSPDFHVCAGVSKGGKGQCNGDSGGPLTVNGKQFGIVSWSVKPCSNAQHPGIYARVAAFRDWIREHSGV